MYDVKNKCKFSPETILLSTLYPCSIFEDKLHEIVSLLFIAIGTMLCMYGFPPLHTGVYIIYIYTQCHCLPNYNSDPDLLLCLNFVC